ncbi:MAG: 6-phosphofructokinase [Thermoplasmatota archaeon]
MTKNIGVLTSGGDAPGMNAALRAIVRTGIYHGFKIYGIRQGYQGLIDDDILEMNPSSVSNIIKNGGTILLTARCQDFFTKEGREKAYNNLQKHGISHLIVIGGDGSFRGLHELINEHPVQAIGIPGTIDNDLFGTDYTIGFDTAVNTALQAIDKIRDTATSHSRLFIIEVMGRNAGYIGLYTGIGGGAEEILIPETETDIKQLCSHLRKGVKRGKNSSIIVVSEGDTAGNAFDLKEKIQQHINWEVRISVLGHQQRGGSPTALDRVLASRLGYESILAINKNQTGIMVGIQNDKITYTPLPQTWTIKKGINHQLTSMTKILAT